MVHKIAKYIIASQLFLFGSLGVCAVLKPHGLLANDGVSYYGIYARTIIPYSIGFVGMCFFLVRLIRLLSYDAKYLRVRIGLWLFLICSVGILVTPYSFSSFCNVAHIFFGAALFVLELIMAAWFAFSVRRSLADTLLFFIQLAAGIASAVYVSPPKGYLIEAQLIFQLVFAILLFRGLKNLVTTDS